jgi:3-hydroxyacyl-[acyl-carrier-protein] dehydratase
VAGKDLIIDPSAYDLDNVLADIEDIRQHIPQRLLMEQLTAVVYDNNENGICVGYKDVSTDEFWVTGHMPGLPLMPGVIMCEAAAQLCSYFVHKHDIMEGKMLGFGGLDGVRFRGIVVPGDRLVICSLKLAVRPGAMIRSRFQCLVNESVVCEGEIRGIPIPVEALTAK